MLCLLRGRPDMQPRNIIRSRALWVILGLAIALVAIRAALPVVVERFVNDKLDRPLLTQLAATGARLVALRCAGFNNVDLHAAAELGINVVRVQAYSHHAVAE